MDLVTFAFLALIALVSGGIAYFADWFGRKLGKKRLRLGSLRPKHTAAVGVVTSGIIISVVTIGLVYALSSDVRTWIKEGRRAIASLRAAERQRDLADAENKQIGRQNSQLVADNKRREEEISRAQSRLSELQNRTQALLSKLDADKADFVALQRKLSSSESQYSQSKESLAKTEEERKKVEASRKAIRADYALLRSSYAQLAQQSKEIQAQNTTLTMANVTLSGTNSQLEDKKTELERNNRLEQERYSRLVAESDNQTAALEDLATKIRLARKEIGDLNVLKGMLDNDVARSRERQLTFSVHEELSRISVPAHLTPDEAQASLMSLIRASRIAAEARGARGVGPDLPAAAIFKHEDPKTHQEFQPDEILDRLAHRIAGKSDEQVLVATSTYNAFEGEPVSIDVAAFPNPLIYRSGQLVAQTRINGQHDEGTIFSNIKEFLDGKVRTKAKSDHLIPGDNDTYGLVDPGQIIKIIKNVQTADRTVLLQAIARNNTRAGDTLQLDFKIR